MDLSVVLGAARERRGEELPARVQWLLFFRLAVAVIGIVLTLLDEEMVAATKQPAYAILVVVCALDLVYLYAWRRIRDLRRFAAAQIVVDGLVETALCYLTGGVYSPAAILFFISILASALCVSGRMGILFASGATIALGGIQFAFHWAVQTDSALPFLPFASVQEHAPKVGRVAAHLVSQGLALHLVAGLSAWLAQELSRRPLYGEILEKMAEGLIAVDAHGRIVFINNEALRLLQYRKTDPLVGRELRDVFKRKEDRDILESLMQGGEPMTVEVEVAMRDGARRQVEVKTSVLRDEGGRIRGTIGIFKDLTLKKQAEEAERRAERLEGIEALAMGIAHEVRNPLASIRGCVQELGRLKYLGEDERQLARIVCRESDRLDAIVGEFLQFARMKPPELLDLDLAALLREVAVLLRGRVPAGGGSGKRVEIALDLVENAHIRADRQQLTQVFLNLGINAIESMETSGGTLAISLRDARGVRHAVTPRGGLRILEDARAYEVAFEDSGRGIAPEDARRIFEPFFTTKPGGTGLGLSIAERIVKLHGGTISAESGLTAGATFRVRLPAEAPVGAPAE